MKNMLAIEKDGKIGMINFTEKELNIVLAVTKELRGNVEFLQLEDMKFENILKKEEK